METMIYDCFTFFNELELLDLRLRVLDPVVDKFVLVESTRTFTGKPKPLFFADNKQAFAKYLDKITHVVVEDSPQPKSSKNVWNVEYHQRNAIMRGLTDANSWSRVMVSDVDEIPHPEMVMRHAHGGPEVVGFPMSLYYYYVNCKQNCIWNGTVMSVLCNMGKPQAMRDRRGACQVNAEKLGWHFSFLGDAERIAYKLASFSEVQVNTEHTSNEDHIRSCLETGDDLFFRKEEYARKQFVPIDSTYPACIYSWLDQYPNFVKNNE